MFGAIKSWWNKSENHSHTRTDVWITYYKGLELVESLPHAYGCLAATTITTSEQAITSTRVRIFDHSLPLHSFSSLIVCVAISQPISNVKCYFNTTLQRIQINLPPSVGVDHCPWCVERMYRYLRLANSLFCFRFMDYFFLDP